MTAKENPSTGLDYPKNPNFGNGIFRRRVRLQKGQDDKGLYVLGEMEDCNHGFSSKVYYANNVVIDIEAEALRTPFNTCPGAITPLRELIGSPLGLTAKAQIANINMASHCTHWIDLSLMCMQHATREETIRDYTVDVPDEIEGQSTQVTIRCNDEIVHQWEIQKWQLLQPQSLVGKTLFKGFAQWANEAFVNDERALEAAFILQKGYFVSNARPMDLQKLAGESALHHTVMRGACYSYSEPQVNSAVRTKDSIRDFTDCAEKLLKFK